MLFASFMDSFDLLLLGFLYAAVLLTISFLIGFFLGKKEKNNVKSTKKRAQKAQTSQK